MGRTLSKSSAQCKDSPLLLGTPGKAGVMWPFRPHVLCREGLRSSAVYLGDILR